jgi:hypothetical protein
MDIGEVQREIIIEPIEEPRFAPLEMPLVVPQIKEPVSP